MTKSRKNTASNKRAVFYITLLKDDDSIVGHRVSMNPPTLEENFMPQPSKSPSKTDPAYAAVSFRSVFQSLTSVMDSYRNFIPLTLSFAPLLTSMIAERKIGSFAKNRGRERSDYSKENAIIYELDFNCYREFAVHSDEVIAASNGAKHLPEIMILGLVSSFDAFLSALLRVVLSRHQEVVLTSEKL